MFFQVPFFSDEEENSSTPKADALLIPRENPRALFIRPVDRVKSEHPKNVPSPLQENGKLAPFFFFFFNIYWLIGDLFQLQKEDFHFPRLLLFSRHGSNSFS